MQEPTYIAFLAEKTVNASRYRNSAQVRCGLLILITNSPRRLRESVFSMKGGRGYGFEILGPSRQRKPNNCIIYERHNAAASILEIDSV